MTPALCATLLASLAGLQLVLTPDDLGVSERVVASPARVGAGVPLPGSRPTSGTSVVPRAMFAPPHIAAGDGGTDLGPLGGAKIAGSVQIGRRRFAVVQYPNGRQVNIATGARVAGWRLTAIGDDAAVLTRSGERISVAFGTVASPTPGDENGEPTE